MQRLAAQEQNNYLHIFPRLKRFHWMWSVQKIMYFSTILLFFVTNYDYIEWYKSGEILITIYSTQMELPSIVVAEYIIERGKLKYGCFDQNTSLEYFILYYRTPMGWINYKTYFRLKNIRNKKDYGRISSSSNLIIWDINPDPPRICQ